MRKRLWQYAVHMLVTLAVLIPAAVVFGLMNDASLHYGDDPRAATISQDGPYIFIEADSSLSVSYVSGSRSEGYAVDRREFAKDSGKAAVSYYAFDSTSFAFPIRVEFAQPRVIHADGNKILALSDIEGNYRALRDFLVASGVIDRELRWTFGTGHLVLVGDVVDRGAFVTQVLWLLYKLEHEAAAQGGQVHLIIGNHELKAMQGDYLAASEKYARVAAVLGRQQPDLYSSSTVIGRWLESKNTMELINGVLFVHGGIHPDVAGSSLGLEEVNAVLRRNFRKTYFPRPTKDIEQLLVSTETGPSWYRGYFRADLTQAQVESGLDLFNASAVVVGHTLQGKVNRQFDGRVIGIDVRHPSDDHKSWPSRRSEGLFIDGGRFYRVLDTGEMGELK